MNFFAVAALFALGVIATADIRDKRQVNYQFPGPRGSSGGGGGGGGQDDSGLYQAPRRQFQAQPVQAYAPPAQRAAASPQAYAPQQQQQAPARRPAPRQQYPQEQGGRNLKPEEEEEDSGPDALTLLLEGSKFGCNSKKDGYYADNSVNCQAFHYCVGGARHSWMCPAGTVFHQVHLNCVPNAQDICGDTEKFHFVNDYLHKELEQRGPNNTILYSQRYYPDGYSVGDTFAAPVQGGRAQAAGQGSQGGQQYQDQGYQAPAAQPQYRQSAPAQQAPAYAPQSYPQAAPARQAYQQPAAPAAAPQQPAYRNYAQGSAAVPVVPQEAPQRRPQGSRSAAPSYQSYPGEGRYNYN